MLLSRNLLKASTLPDAMTITLYTHKCATSMQYQEQEALSCERWMLGCLVLFLVPSFIVLLLLLGCLVASVSLSWLLESRERHLGLKLRVSLTIAAVVSGRDIEWRGRGWETILLIAMLLESSCSRSAPANKAMLMACSTSLEAWRSTIIEVSCSSLTATIIECKYSRAMTTMGSRSYPSSERKAINQASSSIHGALQSITIMIASSSLIVTIIEYNHGL